jgi:ribose transport system substrate-binding protein
MDQPADSHPPADPYRLETVARACKVLTLFRDESEKLRIKDIAGRAGLNRTIAFRLVHTLLESGFLRRVGAHAYQSNVRLAGGHRFRIGYAAQSEDLPFSVAVTEGIERAARRADIDLLLLDNCYNPKTAVRNAERMIAEGVELAIEFQTHEKAAPVIAEMFQQAGIPLIAVEIPHPGATFYGVDNYRVGLLAGTILGNWAKQHWDGQVDEVLLLELGAAGSLPHLRASGVETAIGSVLRGRSSPACVALECNGEFSGALERVRRRLRQRETGRTLIAGVNDPSVLGALRGFEELGRQNLCAGIGLGAIPEARSELTRPGSRLIGSIAFFPEQYGSDLIDLALGILEKRHVPPAVYTSHQLVTARNVSRFYPDYGGMAVRGCTPAAGHRGRKKF